MNGHLYTWAIYSNPIDYPGMFVARQFMGLNGHPVPTSRVIYSERLDDVRALLPPGLLCIDRHPDDDPNIVEVWL